MVNKLFLGFKYFKILKLFVYVFLNGKKPKTNKNKRFSVCSQTSVGLNRAKKNIINNRLYIKELRTQQRGQKINITI